MVHHGVMNIVGDKIRAGNQLCQTGSRSNEHGTGMNGRSNAFDVLKSEMKRASWRN